jgi:RNA polymerase sigma factor (TIGR02999 family)
MAFTNMQGQSTPEKVSGLFAQFRHGNREAAGQLVELLYPELRRIAASKMKTERPEHTWQPTVLVNELYLELLRVKALRDPNNQDEKAAFMGFAGYLMNRLLARHARPLSKKAVKTELEEGLDSDSPGAETLAHVETVLTRLADVDPKFRTVVEMKVFEGRTADEIAAHLGCSRKTADRYWTFASHWLQKELGNKLTT